MNNYITAKQLGIDMKPDSEQAFFRWLLASFLFGKHIQQQIAARAYHELIKAGCTSPKAILRFSHERLVQLLDEAHYVRYDESAARYLLDLADKLLTDYDGKVTNVVKQSDSRQDLARRLQEFKGIGPKTTEIFLREVFATRRAYENA